MPTPRPPTVATAPPSSSDQAEAADEKAPTAGEGATAARAASSSADVQLLQAAWDARATRPDPAALGAAAKAGGGSADDVASAWKVAQGAWVASWGGAALGSEGGRAAWWRQCKKQHAELCDQYAAAQQMPPPGMPPGGIITGCGADGSTAARSGA